ncbi:type VI secretion system contractile sheath large subunit [Vibrio mediterranei]|jgi:type VI secretion system protein ImpD|uniref:type VI secretion system contractile sheath domain-containing protein n=1 Tax=Vibrio mediterranei TaxID=689 RepID=UPI001EFC99AF|nr:type VI secretion system contractile sheath large subunit [Vibrio mediterranei]MCG9626254.1 type VI secretion system contractile sheath large subunit [Vibrio mediterranei]
MNLNFDSQWQRNFSRLDNTDNDFLKESLSLLSEIGHQALNSKASLISFVSQMIRQIDDGLSKQLDKILHHGDFETLHGNWIGLEGLATLPVNKQRTKLKLLDMNWSEVSSDVNQAYTVKGSKLYNKIGNKELNTLGGHPFGCMVFSHRISLNMDFDADYDDLFTLELLSKLGEATLCPMLFSPDKQFFVESSADWLSDTDRIEKILSGSDYKPWQDLRNKVSSKFLGLVMPSIRMRSRYKNAKVGFIYNEAGQGLWGNATFAFAATIMREHHRVNWFGFLKSRWNDKAQGALVNVEPSASRFLSKPETDVVLFGQISSFYAQNGFIPLTKSALSDKFYFNGNNSIWQSGETDNEKVLTQIQTNLMSCRIAHYLKVQVREMVGSFNTAAECELFLTHWIERFSSNVAFANEETLSKYPLSFAKINVTVPPAQTDSFVCTLRMAPQYQYDHFSGEIVLTTELNEVA